MTEPTRVEIFWLLCFLIGLYVGWKVRGEHDRVEDIDKRIDNYNTDDNSFSK